MISDISDTSDRGSPRRGGRPTVEGTGSVVLGVSQVMRAMDGRTAHIVILSVAQCGARFTLVLNVALGDDGRGTMFVAHASPRSIDGAFSPADLNDAWGYTVPLEAAPCRFGGQRWYFLCPLIGWRCAKLYLPSGAQQFMSREAHRLAYRSQRVGPMQATHARLARLHAKLGGSYRSLDTPVPARPKGMHAQTYALLRSELESELAWFRPRYEAWVARNAARANAALSRENATLDRLCRNHRLGHQPE